MRIISLFTKTEITADKVSELLIKDFPCSKKASQNDEIELFIGKSPNNFYIVYKESKNIEDSLCILSDEIKNSIPCDLKFANELYFHKTDIAKYVIKVISNVYPELIIFDGNDFIGTAEEFQNFDF